MTRPRVTLIAASVLALAAGLGTAAPALPADEAAPWEGRAIVEVSLPDDGGAGRLGNVVSSHELEVEGRIPETGQLAVDLGEESVAELRDRLAADPRVERVIPDGPAELRLIPNDPIFSTPDGNAPAGDLAQWHLRHYGAQRAWDLSKGAGAEVAVIDSGIDAAHPDLAGRISGQLSCEPSCAGLPANDDVGHGTHVSGLACADSDNSYGLASLGFDCRIFAVRVELTCFAVAAGITAAADHGSDVINLSLGGCSSSLTPSLFYATTKGAVLVAAGANEQTPDPATNYPAEFIQPEGTGPSLSQNRGLVVTSTKYDGSRSAFAQRTTGVSVSAHGSASDMVSGGQQGILSTFPAPGFPIPIEYDTFTNPVRTTFFGDNRFAYLVGTSMASPQVAGLAALMRSAKPGISNTKLVRLVKLTASGCGSYGNGIGWGQIQADLAVGAAVSKDTDAPSSRVRSARRARGGPGMVNLRLKRFDESCSDEVPESGVKSVIVFASNNGSKYKRIGKTNKKRIRFRGKPGHRYRFFSVAVDKAGNKEPRAVVPDARVRARK